MAIFFNPCSCKQEKYTRILVHYGKDIEMVSKIYQKNKNDPPVARDLPPIAG